MPVRLRITLLFALLVFIILSIVCTGVYYISYTSRVNTIKTRLTNRAITTARLLSQREIFDKQLVQRIDSFTTISLKNKIVQAYDHQNIKIYDYSDVPGDTLMLEQEILEDARKNKSRYFVSEQKEAVAYYYVDPNSKLVIVSAAEDVEGKQNLHTLRNILLLGFLVGNIFVLACGYIFSRSLLLPIKRITQDVAEISARNLTTRIQTGNSKDEWYHLSHTMNDLLNRLQESFELQRRFISNASHELSTPLTSISSQIEVSLQRERNAEEYRKVMQSIHQDVQHMGKLTQTLLEFAKASGSAGGLNIDLIRIDEIVLGIPALLSRINPDYNVVLEFAELPDQEEKLLVFGNEALLQTAIKNIVVNACKYSGNNQAIVNLSVEEKEIHISVRDKGIGIPEEEFGKIFQPFYRIEEHRTTGGFGLGLSLAERIIKLHRGNIAISSEINEGTTFTVNLPIAQIV
ncbi:MAG TPA: HAMP domain-containing sensor histidine kinase [Chitinophagaceae bacterium]|nr:HAMP domain-containing sensor histidine kinase [Chitinophagaceae bacterium]